MTDPSVTIQAGQKDLFTMVVTPDAYIELVTEVTTLRDRVNELQAGQPAITDDDNDPTDTDQSSQIADGMEALSQRIDRHRAELENIKTVVNRLIQWLGSAQSPIPAAQTSATGNTVTATNQTPATADPVPVAVPTRNMIQ